MSSNQILASLQNPGLGEALLIAGIVGFSGVILGMTYQRRFDPIFGMSLVLLSLSAALLFGLIPP